MPCPRCGCRLVSPGSSPAHRLVCSDCGNPMDAQLHLEHPSWGWRELGTSLAVVMIGFSAVGLLWLSDSLSRSEPPQEAPTAEQRPEAD